MLLLRLVLSVCFLGFLLGSANAMNGGDLLEACQADEETNLYYVGLCQGYIDGIYFTYKNMQKEKKIPMSICTPPSLTLGEMVELYVSYVKYQDKTKIYRAEASDLFISAMEEKYPCN